MKTFRPPAAPDLKVILEDWSQDGGKDVPAASADLLEEFVESLPGLFYLFDEAGRILRWNKLAEHLSGRSPEELAAMHPLELIAEEDRELVARRIEDVFRDGEADAEANFLNRAGEKLAIHFAGRLVQLGERRCLLGIGIDISGRKALEQERDGFFAVSSDLFGVTDTAGKIRQTNPAWHAILGWSEHELRESDLAKLVHPEDRPLVRDRLGLATAYGIVNQHGGWMDVNSRIGKGTVFDVYLPASGSGASEVAESSSAEVPMGKECILVVEDEPAVRDLISHVLRFYGYETLEADSGAAALEVWATEAGKIDGVVTDMVMPGGIDGKELARRLLEERPELPVLYTSGYSPDIAGGDLSLQDGVNFLQKPFEASALAQILRTCLDRDGSSE